MRITSMKIFLGKTYQIASTHDTVQYAEAKLYERARFFEGLPIYRLDRTAFAEDGRALRLNIRLNAYEVDASPLYSIHEVDEDRKRRHDSGKLITAIAREFNTVREGKNNDPFSCGTASDEIIAQAERVLAEMTKLRKMLDAASGRVG